MGLYFYVHYGIALLNIGKEIITLHYSASLIDKISERFASVPFMKHQYALFLRELILSNVKIVQILLNRCLTFYNS